MIFLAGMTVYLPCSCAPPPWHPPLATVKDRIAAKGPIVSDPQSLLFGYIFNLNLETEYS